MKRIWDFLAKPFDWLVSLFNWLLGLRNHYAQFRLWCFVWLAHRGKSENQRVPYISDGKPLEVYDLYQLSLVSKKSESPSVLRYVFQNGKWKWVLGDETKRSVTLEKYDLRRYKFYLVHHLYNRSIVYHNFFTPLLKRVSGFNHLTLWVILWVERPLKWLFRLFVENVNDRFNQPERDRFQYLQACLKLGYSGQPFDRHDLLKEVYGTTSFTTREILERNNLADLVIGSLQVDGALERRNSSYVLKPKALTLFQEMSESRQKRLEEFQHNSQIRLLTMVLALGVVFQSIDIVSGHAKRIRGHYEQSFLVQYLTIEQAFWVSVGALVIFVLIFVIKLSRPPKLKIYF